MDRILQLGFGLIVAALAAPDGVTEASPATQSLSVCVIRAQSKKLLGKVVAVTGEVQGNGHGLSMSNSECSLVGVALAESKEMKKSHDPQSELYRDGTRKALLCTDPRVFVATVRGRFGTTVTRGIPIYRIVVDGVLRAEFIQQTSPYCINREPPLPPPALVIPLKPMPDY